MIISPDKGGIFMLKKITIFILIMILLPVQVYALNGLIKKVDLDRNAIMVKNNWYLLQENTEIQRNGNICKLKSCRPVTEGNYQWGHLVFDSSGQLEKLIVEYRVIEGIIKTINYNKKKLTIETYKEPETEDDFYNLSWSQNYIKSKKIKKFQSGDHIIVVSGNDNILKVIKHN